MNLVGYPLKQEKKLWGNLGVISDKSALSRKI